MPSTRLSEFIAPVDAIQCGLGLCVVCGLVDCVPTHFKSKAYSQPMPSETSLEIIGGSGIGESEMPARILEVPLLEPDSFLTIDVGSDLPDDPTEVCQLLADEKCASKWWLAIAAAYAQKAALSSAVEVVTTGLERSPVLRTDEDKMPFHTMLSWLYLQQMRKSPTVGKKEVFDKAMDSVSQGTRLLHNSSDQSLSVPVTLAKGALLASVGNFNDAIQPFQSVLANQPQNIYAKLGHARVLYFRKQYKGALKLYQEILKQAPDLRGSADPRIGLGLCFWQLLDRVKARIAWERVISRRPIDNNEEDPPDVKDSKAVAHSCLGLWFLDSAVHGSTDDFESNYVKSMSHFQKAYNSGQIPLPALKIASYFFSRHEMEKVNRLTDRVLESATLPEILGEALFWKARAAHYANDLDSALTLYTQAISADPENVAAAIGKGIVELAQDRAPEALLTFELIVHSQPRSLDALFYSGLFGGLKGQGESSELRAREMLENYLVQAKLAHQQVKPEALAVLSQLWETHDVQKAYEYLKHASTVMDKMPVAFTINLGSLAFAVGHFDEAESLLRSAIERNSETAADGADSVDAKYKAIETYNLARVQEETGKQSEAKLAYSKLGTQDAKARLLLLNVAATDEYRQSVKQLLDSNPHNLELRALYAWTLRYLIRNGSKPIAKHAAELEQELHKQTLVNVDKHDTYSLVAMGNIYLVNAQSHAKSEMAKRQRSYMRAGEFFEKALQLDRRNAYAAQGVAIALAETKRASLALPIFTRVRESLTADMHSYLNNANCLMENSEYARAGDMYLKAHKMDSGDSSIFSLLARSWLARGSRSKDVDALYTAVEWAIKAAEAADDSVSAKFNVAYVRLQFADAVRRRTSETRTLLQLEHALASAQAAIEGLKPLIEGDGNDQLPFNLSDLEERLDFAESVLLPQLEQAVTTQRRDEQQAEEKRQEAIRKRQEELVAHQEQRLSLQRESEEREAHLAEERLKLQTQAAEWEAERAAEREQQRATGGDDDDGKKSRKKRSKRGTVDDLVDDSQLPENYSESSEDERYKEKLSRKKARSKANSKSDTPKNEDEHNDVESDSAEKVQRKQAVVNDDDDDDDDKGEEKKSDLDELNDLF